MEAMPATIINGHLVQIVMWSGPDIPDEYVPLDGRTINGITLPDHSAKFLYGTGQNAAEYPTPAIPVLTEVVRIKDFMGEV